MISSNPKETQQRALVASEAEVDAVAGAVVVDVAKLAAVAPCVEALTIARPVLAHHMVLDAVVPRSLPVLLVHFPRLF